MLLNSRQFKFLKNYRNVYVKSSAKREYRDENVFLKGDRALSKLITLLISNKKEFNHFFKSRNSDIVLLKLGNLHQNAKRYEARNTEREARDENVRAKRVDFFPSEEAGFVQRSTRTPEYVILETFSPRKYKLLRKSS